MPEVEAHADIPSTLRTEVGGLWLASAIPDGFGAQETVGYGGVIVSTG